MAKDSFQSEVVKLRQLQVLALRRVLVKLDDACKLLNPLDDFQTTTETSGSGKRRTAKRSLAPMRWRYVIDGHRMLAAALEKAGGVAPVAGETETEDEAAPLKGLRITG